MTEKYEGSIGPADAMSATDDRFVEAYVLACGQSLAAIMEFEKATGRIVDSISLEQISVTTVSDAVPKHIRSCLIHFLPKPGEVAW